MGLGRKVGPRPVVIVGVVTVVATLGLRRVSVSRGDTQRFHSGSHPLTLHPQPHPTKTERFTVTTRHEQDVLLDDGPSQGHKAPGEVGVTSGSVLTPVLSELRVAIVGPFPSPVSFYWNLVPGRSKDMSGPSLPKAETSVTPESMVTDKLKR